jgi:hypothetical protein
MIIDELYFNITMDFYGNLIYIRSLSDDFQDVQIVMKDIDGANIYSTQTSFNKGVVAWYKPDSLFINFTYVIVQVLKDNNIIKEERFRIKDSHNRVIKPIAVYCERFVGLGDFMMAIPLIRKLYEIYEQKLLVIGNWNIQEYLINCKYVNVFMELNTVDINYVKRNFEVFNIYDNVDIWSTIDTRKWLSKHITLKEEELTYEYIPDRFYPIEGLPPDRYVCINPNQTGEERGWSKEKWQELADILNKNNIPVVSIGKNNYFNLDIKLGMDLAGKDCQNNLSQAWHIIDKSEMFVTFTSGMFILSQTTGTHIIELATYMDPYLQKSKRDGKYTFIIGDCSEFCRSNLKYNVNENGTIKRVGNYEFKCMLNIGYICKPEPGKVINEILKIW